MEKERQKKSLFLSRALFGILVLFLLIALVVGIVFFNHYTREQLYQEANSQLTEITSQLFEKLTVQLDIQWDYLDHMLELRDRTPIATKQELVDFLKKCEETLSSTKQNLVFYALDDKGYYYTHEGQQGRWSSATELLDGSEQKCFLIADWVTNENQMVFAHQLENQLQIEGTNVTYFMLLRKMDDIAPYFRSSAFHNHNTTYVIDENGSKMFEDTVLTELDFQGRNLFRSLERQVYPHKGSFDACLKEAQETGFVCSDITVNKANYYMVFKQLSGYSWSMLIFVPENEVAASTRGMVESMISVFILIISVLILFCIIAALFVIKFRKNQELLLVKTQSEEKLAQANNRLKEVNASLKESNQKLEEAQNTVAEALAAAKAASKAKSDFLANMSHDIRTPMNAIIGMTALIEHDAESPEKIREYTKKVNNSSQHLLGLINEVLDMSKIESGKLVLNSAEFDLKELLEQVEAGFRPQMNAKEQKFSITTNQISHNWLIGDNVRVLQILNNLLSNSFKYTPTKGQIRLDVDELKQTSHNYAKICFRVRDNGIGMSSEYLSRIYDSFSREERTTVNTIQGTGLGMSIVKSLVDLMGGSISVDSIQGKGTQFVVVLDFKISERNEKREEKPETLELDEDTGLKGMHFLCAEDNELNAEILSELLEIEGASCEICENGQVVVERFEQSKPGEFDMILMDVQMPIMNGYEATKAIRNGTHPLAKTIPIIAMTANAFSEDIQNSLNAGMDAHVSKPVDMKTLIKTVHSIQSGVWGGRNLRRNDTWLSFGQIVQK